VTSATPQAVTWGTLLTQAGLADGRPTTESRRYAQQGTVRSDDAGVANANCQFWRFCRLGRTEPSPISVRRARA